MVWNSRDFTSACDVFFHLALLILQTIQVIAVVSIAAALFSSLCIHLLFLAMLWIISRLLQVYTYCIYIKMHFCVCVC